MSKTAYLLRRNSLFAFSSTCIRLLTNAVMFIIIARFYGPESFGQFATAHTLSTIFILVADFGFDLLLTTQIASNHARADYLLPRMLAFKLLFTSLAVLIMGIYPSLITLTLRTKILIYIFCFYVFFSTAINFFFALFRGYEEFQHETAIAFVMNILLLIGLISLGLVGASIYWIAGAFVTSRILGLVLSLLRSKRFKIVITPIWDLKWMWKVKDQVLYFGLFIVFGNLFFTIDTILLSLWKGDYQVGIYQAVFRLVTIILVVPDILINILLPTLSRYFIADKLNWQKLGSLVSKTLFFISLVIGFVVYFFANEIINVVYNNSNFNDAKPILEIFAIIITVRYSVEIPALMLTTSGRQSTRMLLAVLATVVNLLINIIVIPKYGILGAAYTSLFTNLLIGAGYCIAIRNDFNMNLLQKAWVLPFMVVLFGGIIMTHCSVPIWNTALVVIVLYFLIVYFFGYSSEEKDLILRKIILPGL